MSIFIIRRQNICVGFETAVHHEIFARILEAVYNRVFHSLYHNIARCACEHICKISLVQFNTISINTYEFFCYLTHLVFMSVFWVFITFSLFIYLSGFHTLWLCCMSINKRANKNCRKLVEVSNFLMLHKNPFDAMVSSMPPSSEVVRFPTIAQLQEVKWVCTRICPHPWIGGNCWNSCT